VDWKWTVEHFFADVNDTSYHMLAITPSITCGCGGSNGNRLRLWKQSAPQIVSN
jgi:hypothetical protein